MVLKADHGELLVLVRRLQISTDPLLHCTYQLLYETSGSKEKKILTSQQTASSLRNFKSAQRKVFPLRAILAFYTHILQLVYEIKATCF